MIAHSSRIRVLTRSCCIALLLACSAFGQADRGGHIVQEAYLKASNTESGDWFGRSVAVSGDTAIVGAYQESGGATGVNGNQHDNSAPRAGAAYVYVRNGMSWSQQAYLKASNTEQDDFFGSSVAISGDTVVVGAPGESSSATGVDGDGIDNSAVQSGAAYVFVRNGTSWSQQAYLKADNTDSDDRFGYSVGVSGSTAVVGALGEDSGASGVNGDSGDDSASFSGAAYVFQRNGVTWSQEAYLKASNTDASDAFGHCVAVSGDTIVSGAYKEASNASGVDGDQDDNSATDAGAAYVFERSESTWSQVAYLKASNTGAADTFGWSVAVSNNRVVIGADREDSSASGVNGDQIDNSAPGAGAAYVFMRRKTGWVQEAYLKASNTDEDDYFGQAVAISGDTVVVGASGEDSTALGVNGNQGDDEATLAGAAYVFEQDGSTWSQQAYLKASNTDPLDGFGRAVAVLDDTVLITSLEGSSAIGVNGDQSDNSAPEAGAVYAFDLDADLPGVGFCFGDRGSGTPCPCENDNDGSVSGSGCANGVFDSGAQLTGIGLASVSADSLVLTTTGLEPNNSGLYFQGDNDLSPGVVWGDGLRCVGGALKRLQVRFADTTGTSFTTIGIAAKVGNVTAGSLKRYQCWYRTNLDPPCGAGVNDFNSSNGYAVTWVP